ncbi:MAG: DUF357 domain-containing protein [Candidatus Nanoarchaeia archaeon]
MTFKNDTITKELLDKYFKITGEALEKVKSHEIDIDRLKQAKDFLHMAQCYYDDAQHFFDNNNWVLAYAALNYAHGWLDAGARSGLFKVKDSRLFTVDDDN